jgi:hypothetical protein
MFESAVANSRRSMKSSLSILAISLVVLRNPLK